MSDTETKADVDPDATSPSTIAPGLNSKNSSNESAPNAKATPNTEAGASNPSNASGTRGAASDSGENKSEEADNIWDKWAHKAEEFFTELVGNEESEEKKRTQFAQPDTSATKVAQTYFNRLKTAVTKMESLFVLRAQDAAKAPENGDMYRTGGFGFAEVMENKDIESAFFKQGRMFKVNLCHANLLNTDDASADVRVASLSLTDTDGHERCDFVMMTGSTNIFYNLATYSKFLEAVRKGDLKEWALQAPANFISLVKALRRCPSSYADLVYYGHCTNKIRTPDNEVKLVRFRIAPVKGDDEASRLDEEGQRAPWVTDRKKGTWKTKNYLRNKFRYDISRNDVRYFLQVQVNSPIDTETEDLYNTGVEWDLPWTNLAFLAITTPLTDLAASKISYNVMNLPDNLWLPSPVSVFDFKSYPSALGQFCEASNQQNRKHPPGDAATVPYAVVVKVSDAEFAGTDADVNISVIGRQGMTSPKRLDRIFKDDFERGSLESYHFLAEDVGVPIAINITLQKKWYNRMLSDMKLDYVQVLNTALQSSAYFPYFNWIEEAALIPDSTVATGSNERSLFISRLRRYAVYELGDDVMWYIHPQLQGGILIKGNELPQQFKKDRSLSNEASRFLTNISKPLGRFRSFETLGQYLEYAQECNPVMANNYSEQFDNLFTDAEFGRQFLNGIDPTVIRRLDSLPENFPVTAELVAESLDRGISFYEEIASGNIYLVDYPNFDGIPGYNKKGTRRYVAAPMALLYMNANDELIPIAIQLKQNPCIHNPIFTPQDGTDWFFAKLWVKSAASQHQQIYTMFTKSLFTLEAISVALERNLYQVHPIYKLLKPSLKDAVANSTIERENLFGDDGLADRTMSLGSAGALAYMKKCYKDLNLFSLAPDFDLRDRNLLEACKNYHWRADAIAVWGLISQWVEAFLKRFYKSDGEVAADRELRNMMLELHSNGLRIWSDDSDHCVPESIEYIEQLAEFVTLVIYSASFGYASLNYPREEYEIFIPNSPSAMLVPPPEAKGKVTMETVTEALPKGSMAMDKVSYILSRTKLERIQGMMKDYANPYFAGTGNREALEGLQRRMFDLEDYIESLNEARRPYSYFNPSKVPVNITF